MRVFRAHAVADFYFLYKFNRFPNLGNEHLKNFCKLSYGGEKKAEFKKHGGPTAELTELKQQKTFDILFHNGCRLPILSNH